jgi:hypothetical protein
MPRNRLQLVKMNEWQKVKQLSILIKTRKEKSKWHLQQMTEPLLKILQQK